MSPSDDRPFPGEGESSPDDESGDRIAGLRESIAKRLEEVVHALGEELRSETKERLSQHASTLESASKAQAQALVDRVSEQLRIGYETVANETATRTNELASTTAAEVAKLRNEISSSLAGWKSEAQAEVGEATRAAAVELLEERTAAARKALAKQNEAALDAAILSVNEQALREVKRRGAKLEKRLRTEIGEKLTAAEQRLARTASHDQAALAAELQDETAARLGAAQSEITERLGAAQAEVASQVDTATATLHKRVVEGAAAEFGRRTDEAIETLRSEGEASKLAALEELGQAHATQADRSLAALDEHRAAIQAEAVAAQEAAEARLGAVAAEGLAATRGALERAASEHRTEVGEKLEAQVAQGLREAAERISGEVRTELASGLADAERTLDERSASRMADHTSRLVEQAATHATSLSDRATELAAESETAAEVIARLVAKNESKRMYRELSEELDARIAVVEKGSEARIAAAEKASAAESARVRTELEDVNQEAARVRLEEALERVRSEGATELASQKEVFAKEAAAIRTDLDKVVEAGRAELREVVASSRTELGALAEDLEKREQRRELRLAKAETSKRIKGALSNLEKERGRVDSLHEDAVSKGRVELEGAIAEAMKRIDEHAEDAGRSVGGVGERLADALNRAEATVVGDRGVDRADLGARAPGDAPPSARRRARPRWRETRSSSRPGCGRHSTWRRRPPSRSRSPSEG